MPSIYSRLVTTRDGERYGYYNLPYYPNPRLPHCNRLCHGNPENGILLLAVYEDTGTVEWNDYLYDCINELFAFINDDGAIIGFLPQDNICGFTHVSFEEWRDSNSGHDFSSCPNYHTFRSLLENATQRDLEGWDSNNEDEITMDNPVYRPEISFDDSGLPIGVPYREVPAEALFSSVAFTIGGDSINHFVNDTHDSQLQAIHTLRRPFERHNPQPSLHLVDESEPMDID